ncbi:MAG: hypothetical protein U1F06_07730 [Steroidobacteraceae bacterium]
MLAAEVVAGHAGRGGAARRHRAVAAAGDVVGEFIAQARESGDGALADPDDRDPALVGRRECRGQAARGLQQRCARRERAVRPVARVEEIEFAAHGRRRQHLVQAREAAEHAGRERLGIVAPVERGQPAHDRIGAAQRLERRVAAGVRRADGDEAHDARLRRRGERHARQQPAHAVGDQVDLARGIGGEPRAELAPVATMLRRQS